MNLPADLATLPGLDQLRAVFAGRSGYEGIVKTPGRRPASVEEGFIMLYVTTCQRRTLVSA